MARRSSLKVNDKKWRALKKQLGNIDDAEVTVGIQSDADDVPEGAPLAARAAFNEFGTRGGASGGGWGGPVPARPFMGSTFDERQGVWGKAADTAISRALAGTRGFEHGLGDLGEMTQEDIQNKIDTLSSPPNSAVTVEMKGSSNPLIDTGAMRQNIRYEVKL